MEEGDRVPDGASLVATKRARGAVPPLALTPAPTSNRHAPRDTRGQPGDNLAIKPASRKTLFILAAGVAVLIAATVGSGVIMTISMLLPAPE